jgi:hypothetical protein
MEKCSARSASICMAWAMAARMAPPWLTMLLGQFVHRGADADDDFFHAFAAGGALIGGQRPERVSRDGEAGGDVGVDQALEVAEVLLNQAGDDGEFLFWIAGGEDGGGGATGAAQRGAAPDGGPGQPGGEGLVLRRLGDQRVGAQ